MISRSTVIELSFDQFKSNYLNYCEHWASPGSSRNISDLVAYFSDQQMWVILKESVQLKGLDTTGFDLEGPKLRQVPMPEHGVTSKSTKGPGAP